MNASRIFLPYSTKIITSYPGVNVLQNCYPLVYCRCWYDDKTSGGNMCEKISTDTQVGSSFLVKRASKTHTQTSAMHSRAALQVVMMFVAASVRYLPLIRYAIHQYAAAMFKILYSYSGWQCANYVLNEVKNPIRTIKIAGPLGLGITSALYIFANIAYFAYVRSSLHLLDQRRFLIIVNAAHRQRQKF
jgi:hypothetical protein